MAKKSTSRRHAKIDQLTPALRDRVVEMLFAENRTLDQATEYLRSQGVEIGRSSVGRFVERQEEILQRQRDLQEMAQKILDATGNDESKLPSAMMQMVSQQMLSLLLKFRPEEIDEVSINQVVNVCNAVARLGRTPIDQAKYRQEQRQARLEAERQLSRMAKSGKINEDARQRVQELFGLFVPTENT